MVETQKFTGTNSFCKLSRAKHLYCSIFTVWSEKECQRRIVNTSEHNKFSRKDLILRIEEAFFRESLILQM